MRRHSGLPKLLLGLGLAAWSVAAAIGFRTLERHQTTPGRPASPLVDWPAGSGVSLDADRLTLLVFVHPHCPCTDATLEELETVLQSGSAVFRPIIVLFKPGGTDESWEATKSRRIKSAIPSAEATIDLDGKVAARFGVQTSGHVLVYDSKGTLLFSGGVTPSRGRRGDNLGRAAITALAQGRLAPQLAAPVFGCSLSQTND